jgi:predicted phosphodiesterase
VLLPRAEGRYIADMAGSGLVTVGVAGDWHHNTRWALRALSGFHDAGVSRVWHLGDFGLRSDDGGYLDAVQDACARLGMTILVTPGNHEDYSQLSPERGVTTWVRDRIAFLPRGDRFTVNGWRVLSFGGAASINFEYKVEGVSWWRAELPTEDEVDAAIAVGPCDILLLHNSSDAPYATGAVSRILCSGDGWSDRALAYASIGRERVSRLRAGVRPYMALHGHYHVADIAQHSDSSWTVSMAAAGAGGNLGLLRLPAKQADGSNVAPGETPTAVFSFLAEADGG